MEESGDDFELDGDNDDDNGWFAAKDGLRAVRGLLDALGDGSIQADLSDAETVLNDLEELARCLGVAAKRKAMFRLIVG